MTCFKKVFSRMKPTNGPNCKCSQAYYLKRHGTYCPHWEEMLPSVGGPESTRLVFTPEPERFENVFTPEDETMRLEHVARHPTTDVEDLLIDDEGAQVQRLIATGLSEKKARVVAARICQGATFKDIAQQVGYRRAEAAVTAYKDAIKFLETRIEAPKPRGKK